MIKRVASTLFMDGLLLSLLVFPGIASAISIRYEITDLPDTTPGEERWEYKYSVSDYTFKAGHGFTIYLDHTLYRKIEGPPPPVNGDWDVKVWQPDPGLPDAGAYDALSITSKADGASLADAFTVTFVWMGEGIPGSQPFEVYDPDFNTLASGKTISASMNPWDVNGDNKVDIFDLVFVGGQFGKTLPNNPAADVNRDGTVNIFDLVLVGSHFGEIYGLPAAPPIASHQTGGCVEVRMAVQRISDRRITIHIHADAVAKLSGFHFELRFDPKQLTVIKVTEGSVFAAQGYQSYWLPPKTADGKLLIGAVALKVLKPSSVVDYAGALAQVTFNVKGDVNAAMGSMRLENVQLADLNGRAVRADVHHSAGATLAAARVEHNLQDALFQNYPNPFNPETWMPYTLAKSAVVTISIYNAQGHLIRSLKPGFQSAGVYRTRADAAYWDGHTESGEPVSSGVYYYTIHAGDFTATRKMLVVK